MPHFKCEACRTRLYSASILTEIVGDHCPHCDSLLEPVGDLSEVVGFRSITSRNDDVSENPSSAHDRVAAGVGDLLARRARHEQARLDVERWGDDGGSAAAAMPVPRPSQRPPPGKTRV
ncbi:MAG: hypothetical protein QOI98_1292 [Solirubrobacteraceae bacterium]|nr:hypothetical protein [Solirubrobacteraceae bacterium]